MIDDHLYKYKKLINVFSDKTRVREGKTYIPPFLINNDIFEELIGVIKGVKPVMEMNFYDQNIEKIEESFMELEEIYGLKYKISDYKFLINSFKDESSVVERSDPRRGLMSVSVSPDKKKAERSEYLFLKKSELKSDSKKYSHEFATLMGYPECCVNFAKKISGDKNNEKAKRENLLWSKIEIRSFMESDEHSKLLNIFTINPLIPHIPCNLNCEPSKEYATKMKKVFKDEFPAIEELINYFLDLHALFWHYSEKFLIHGKNDNSIKERAVKYDDIQEFSYSEDRFYGETEKEFKEKFEKTKELLLQGNKIVMKKDSFNILKDDVLLGSVEKDYEYSCVLF